MSSSTKKILYLSYDGMCDVLGQSQVIPYLTGLQKQGFEISILSFEKKQRLQERGQAVDALLKEQGIKWEHELFSSGMPVIPKLLDRKKMISRAKALYKVHRYDLVHCRSYVAAEAGYQLKRQSGIKFIFDMRGFWVDERVEGGMWNLANPIYKLAYNRYKKLEKKMLAAADRIVCLTQPAYKILIQWGTPEAKISVIPCMTDLYHFTRGDKAKRNELRAKLKVADDEMLLVYLGSLGTWYLSDEMLKFFKLFSAKQKAKILFLTPDDPDTILVKTNALKISPEQLIIHSVHREDLPAYLSTCDVGLFFIKPTFSKTASSPTKLGELLACGLPVICNSGIGDVDEILIKNKCGVIVKEFNSSAYEQAVDVFLKSKFVADEIRKAAEENFDLQTGILKYSYIYRQLLGSR